MIIYLGCPTGITKTCLIRIETRKYIRHINFYDNRKIFDLKTYKGKMKAKEKVGIKWVKLGTRGVKKKEVNK